MDRLADWFASELAAIDGSVDLVGQDWGALISLRVLADHPENVRSWTLDAANLDDDFIWHDSAKLMQSPEGDLTQEQDAIATEDQRPVIQLPGDNQLDRRTTRQVVQQECFLHGVRLELHPEVRDLVPAGRMAIAEFAVKRGALVLELEVPRCERAAHAVGPAQQETRHTNLGDVKVV